MFNVQTKELDKMELSKLKLFYEEFSKKHNVILPPSCNNIEKMKEFSQDENNFLYLDDFRTLLGDFY